VVSFRYFFVDSVAEDGFDSVFDSDEVLLEEEPLVDEEESDELDLSEPESAVLLSEDLPSDGLLSVVLLSEEASPDALSAAALSAVSEVSGLRESLMYQPEPLKTIPTG